MKFLDFKKAVYQRVFPQAESSRLDPRHESWIVDCLIEIQQKIRCLQSDHKEYIGQSATYFSCGATAFPIPPGSYIKSLAVEQVSNPCNRVQAVPYTEAQFRGVIQRQIQCACSPAEGNPGDAYAYSYDYGEADPELRPATTEDDLTYTPTDRAFAIYDGLVWLWPRLSSTETVVLRWNGVKKSWNNNSVLSWLDEAGGPDREVQQLVEWFLLSRYYQFDRCDPEKAAAANAEYMRKRAEMIIDCQRRHRLPDQTRTQTSC